MTGAVGRPTAAGHPPATARAARIVLVGIGGYGLVHAERIAALQATGDVELVAAVDPVRSEVPPIIAGTALFPDLAEALTARGPADVVVIAAPIPEHARLAEVALTSGADVLLEKPPMATFADFTRLLAVEQQTGRVVQVGFQSLGSHGLAALRDGALGLGPIERVTAVGAWSRTAGYWARSPWAGRRSLADRPVVDGVVTNPLAHATATALAVVGCRRAEDVISVDADLYRANPIDADDTSVVRIRTSAGFTVMCAYTLCAAEQTDPVVRVTGSKGRADFSYTVDELTIELDGDQELVSVGRDDLLENLLAHRRDGSDLLVPLVSTGAFMRVLEAIAETDPVRVDPHSIVWSGDGADRRPVITGIEEDLNQAVNAGATFTELGLPWTHRSNDAVLVHGRVDRHPVDGGRCSVLDYRDGAGTLPTSSPRPYLHPVRTLGGVLVSATHPADHDWHTGVGLAIPDVNGSNLWGGGTYRDDRGYRLEDDHGSVRGGPVQQSGTGFHQELDWLGADGQVELHEHRRIDWTAFDTSTWRLRLDTELSTDHRAVINSPGSKGRVGGGYGGFFWRFPSCTDIDVFTEDVQGEADVHGCTALWIAWSADFGAGPGLSGPATVVIMVGRAERDHDPWFVRVADYPGIGSAMAWDRPLVLESGASWVRRFEMLIIDGRRNRHEVVTMIETADGNE